MDTLSGYPLWWHMAVGAGLGVLAGFMSCRKDPDRWVDVAVIVAVAMAIAFWAGTKWDRATGTGWWATPGDTGLIAKLTARGKEQPYLKRRGTWLAMSDGERARWRVSMGAVVGTPLLLTGLATVLYMTRRRDRPVREPEDWQKRLLERPNSDVFPDG